MQKKVFSEIRSSVQEKKHNLNDWMETTPDPEKELHLDCSDCEPVQPHLAVLDETLEKIDEHSLGVCVICHGEIEENVLEIDYTASVCLDCLSEVQRRQLESELEFSSEVQRALLPQYAPSIPGLEIGAFSRPAQIIGGDYFDFFRYKSGSYGLAIGDVSGHGISSSLLMSSLQTAMHTLTSDTDSASDVLQRINHYFLHNVALTTFITLFLGNYDPGPRRLSYSNAGHNPPILYHRNGARSVAWLNPTGAAVGLVEEYPLHSDQVLLQPDDILLLYTDGVTELAGPTGEFFGSARLEDLLASNASLPAQELVSALRKGLDEFLQGLSPADDITIVAIKVVE